MYNARLRTDTSPVWTLVVIGDWEPPQNWAYEVYWYYGKDYKWHQQHLQSFQAAIQVLPDSPYAFVPGNEGTQQGHEMTGISVILPVQYQPQIYTWYTEQKPRSRWTPFMRALTTMGLGYVITRVPKKISPFRPVQVI